MVETFIDQFSNLSNGRLHPEDDIEVPMLFKQLLKKEGFCYDYLSEDEESDTCLTLGQIDVILHIKK